MSAELDTLHKPQMTTHASSSSESVDVQTISLSDPTKVYEDALVARASKRAERWTRNHEAAVEHSRVGDELFERRDYAGACTRYVDATNLWASNATYYSKLAAAYLKCELHVEAAHASTRSLALNPTSIEARYQRGVARLEQRLLKAAKMDFDTIIQHEPTHEQAKLSLQTVTQLIEASSKLGAHQISELPTLPEGEGQVDVDFEFPHFDDDKLELASMSDSSDCNHVGNGIACRFYNHVGCARGNDCIFSHAPDEKSVRDDLGKNVCIYYLLSSCKFGDLKCIYAHSKRALPTTRGWWNDEAQIQKVKNVMEIAEKKIKEQRALDILLMKLEASKMRKARAAKAVKKANDVLSDKKTTAKENPDAIDGEGIKMQGPIKAVKKTSIRGKKKDRNTNTAAVGGEKKIQGNQKQAGLGGPESNTDTEDDEQGASGGFTDYQLNELLSQGVKPWDDDAHIVLAALSY